MFAKSFVVAGLEGNNCAPDTYSGWFGEFGVSAGLVGGSLDFASGVVEGAYTAGGGAQAGACFYVYVSDK